MTVLLRFLARLLTFLLLLVLALVGLAVAIFALVGPGLADPIPFSDASQAVGAWLRGIDAPSTLPKATALAALAAILAGLLLLVGALARTPERLVVLEKRDGGVLGARRGPLSQAADALIGRVRGVTARRVSLQGRKGDRLEVTATHTRAVPADGVEREVSSAVRPLAEAFGLRTRVRARVGDSGSRVE